MKAHAAPSPLLLSVLVASLAGCGEPPDDTIDVVFDPCEPLVLELDDDATAAEVRSAARAIELWNERYPTRLTLRDLEEAARLPVAFDDAASAFHGLYDDEVGVVWINRELEGDERAVTIAHEVGHAFGLLHVEEEERRSVMNSGNLVISPTEGDAAALVATWGRCASEHEASAGEQPPPE